MPRLARPRFASHLSSVPAGYSCPVGDHPYESALPTADQWTACPMLGGNPICEGACIDMQLVAREDDTAAAPFGEEFLALASAAGTSPLALRLPCLLHQVELFEAELTRGGPPAATLMRALGDVRTAARRVEEALAKQSPDARGSSN